LFKQEVIGDVSRKVSGCYRFFANFRFRHNYGDFLNILSN